MRAVARLGDVLRRVRRPRVAAAVPVRRRAAGGLEFLLVRTSNGARWTFPKGGIDPGETPAAAAAREAREEAGVTGAVGSEALGVYRYAPSRNGADDVTAFLLEVDRDGLSAEAGRDPTWCGLEAARSKLAEGREPGYGEAMERVLRAAEGAVGERADSGDGVA
jgi:8-oxo-dGTP pyrophosphatase MutT (NUDIX family)